jgi:dihydrofolate reductase
MALSQELVEAKAAATAPIWMIAAMDEGRAIGVKNDMPWKIPGELRRFKDLTMGSPMIMGRSTYESIGRPLPGRRTIVLSRSKDLRLPAEVLVCGSIVDAVKAASTPTPKAICIAGGEAIYKEFLPIADRLYITVVHARHDADRFFPPFEDLGFTKVEAQRVEGAIPYTTEVYDRAR